MSEAGFVIILFQGESSQAVMLGKAIEEKVKELQGLLTKAVAADENPQIAHAANLQGKIQLAQQWLSDPLKHATGTGDTISNNKNDRVS